MFKCKQKEFATPMIEKDHPEIDTSALLDSAGIKLFQSLIGALQWLVTLGQIGSHLDVATMASYRCSQRIGHVERLKRMYGYLCCNTSGAIRFRVNIPNNKSLPTPVQYNWCSSINGNVTEALPTDQPVPQGKDMRTITYQDANLYHDLVTGRAMSGIIHFVRQTPAISFCKKQQSVETATYGSEFMVTRQSAKQIIDLHNTLCMMGKPLDGPSWMLGDNESVITSSTIPHSTLSMRHNALSYHCVRECIAAKFLYLLHVSGKVKLTDMLTKPLCWTSFWPLVQPLIFWEGDTIKDKTFSVVILKIKADPPIRSRGVTARNHNL
jgi:hypothetical protein